MAKPSEVATYYDEWNERYRKIYGDVIQAFRPTDTKQLLGYTLESLSLKEGMKLIDAGCGYAGPSRFFAAHVNVHIDAVTISSQQAREATEKIEQEKLGKNILIHEGDFHKLGEKFASNNYDGVFFLESLGHSNDISAVIKGVWEVLKFGGFVYIKDFFYKETNDVAFNQRVQSVVQKVNEDYSYNVLSLLELLRVLRSFGFIIEFVRPPKFADDISIRKEFEVKNGIDTFGGEEEFYYAEWLEIKCVKFQN